ncbi:MAG: HNH endonuclease [Actinomycetia bacterium]|nr:HNH endonuclease [Actinomycetes bacterium]
MKILIDSEDEWLLKAFKWHKHKKEYVTYARAYITGTKTRIVLHQAIIGRPLNGLVIDHKNKNGLDNRRKNLRIVKNTINQQNRIFRKNKTGFQGVSFNKGKYRAQIYRNGIRKYLGSFDTPEEAHKSYIEAGVNTL